MQWCWVAFLYGCIKFLVSGCRCHLCRYHRIDLFLSCGHLNPCSGYPVQGTLHYGQAWYWWWLSLCQFHIKKWCSVYHLEPKRIVSWENFSLYIINRWDSFNFYYTTINTVSLRLLTSIPCLQHMCLYMFIALRTRCREVVKWFSVLSSCSGTELHSYMAA